MFSIQPIQHYYYQLIVVNGGMHYNLIKRLSEATALFEHRYRPRNNSFLHIKTTKARAHANEARDYQIFNFIINHCWNKAIVVNNYTL